MSSKTIALSDDAMDLIFTTLHAEADKQEEHIAETSGAEDSSTPKELRSLANDVFDLQKGKHSGLEIRRA